MKKLLCFMSFVLVISSSLMISCASMKAPIINQIESIDGFKYVYITPTKEITSGIMANSYGITKTSNPSDLIAGILIKQGFIRLPELNSQLLDETLIVNYGESGRRNVNLGYSIEVTIQFLSAKTNMPVCVCTAEGQGSTEADDIRIAINRALKPLFKTANK